MKIAILTSGGDSPGMNAAIRSIVVAAHARNHETIGVEDGYAGLLERRFRSLSVDEVTGISRFGGTILGSARSPRMLSEDGMHDAVHAIQNIGLDGVVVIGGNGSLSGAHALCRRVSIPVVGIPASIDNDVGHCGLAIGVDTAVNTIVEACDRIRDTAGAHRRAFIVEVMGRHCGYLAMRSGIAAEADAILYAEKKRSEADLVDELSRLLEKSFSLGSRKRSVLIVKAEGVEVPSSTLRIALQERLERVRPGFGIREVILGHVVRGGSPSATDRVIAQRLGLAALYAVEAGTTDVMASWEPPGKAGAPTTDPSVRLVPLADMLEETTKLLDGTSVVTQKRLQMLAEVEGLIAL